MPVPAAATTRVTWDVHYAIRRWLGVVFATRGVLSWVITMAMRAMTGGIDDRGSLMRIMRALRRVVGGHCLEWR